MRSISRLEKTLFRLQGQHACFAWLIEQIGAHPGAVIELGLGQGRTYDHLRRHLPGRDIYVFDRVNKAYDDCQPDADHLFLGEIEATFPALMKRAAGQAILANSDLGSFDRARNDQTARMIARLLPEAMASGGFIMSDLPLDLPGFAPLPLPEKAPADSYYLYQKRD
jgi:hypothetical protein